MIVGDEKWLSRDECDPPRVYEIGVKMGGGVGQIGNEVRLLIACGLRGDIHDARGDHTQKKCQENFGLLHSFLLRTVRLRSSRCCRCHDSVTKESKYLHSYNGSNSLTL